MIHLRGNILTKNLHKSIEKFRYLFSVNIYIFINLFIYIYIAYFDKQILHVNKILQLLQHKIIIKETNKRKY